jgi:hypothetical protein
MDDGEDASVADLLNEIDARAEFIREVSGGHEGDLSSEIYHLENVAERVGHSHAEQYLRGYIDALYHAKDKYEKTEAQVTDAARDITEHAEELQVQDGDTDD